MNTQPNTPASRNEEDAARWRRLVNASEASFPVASIADDPENDARMIYGRKRLEQFIDGLDEISDQYALAAPGAAIDAREQAPIADEQLTKAAFFAFAEKSVQLVSQIGTWSPEHMLTKDGKELLRLLNEVLTAPRPEAPPASASPATVARRYCNKCGYFGPDELHDRPNGSGRCGYLSCVSAPSEAQLRETHAAETHLPHFMLNAISAFGDDGPDDTPLETGEGDAR